MKISFLFGFEWYMRIIEFGTLYEHIFMISIVFMLICESGISTFAPSLDPSLLET